MTDSPAWLQLHSDSLTAAIDPQGAQLSALRDGRGKDLLWDGDPAFWNGRAPVLFPIVGALNDGHYRWRGKRYALARHGFARGRGFEVLRHNAQGAWLRLQSDPATQAVYPFPFELGMSFQLEGNALQIESIVRNTGDQPMPASIGFHPALRWPLPGAVRGQQFLEFEHDEPAPVRRLDANGLLTAALHATPVRGKRLLLNDALFAEDVVIFDQLASRSLEYGADAGVRLRVSFPEITHLGLWSKPGAGFVCVEPWLGVADPAGFDGELDTKPGVFLLAPGQQRALRMRLELLPAA